MTNQQVGILPGIIPEINTANITVFTPSNTALIYDTTLSMMESSFDAVIHGNQEISLIMADIYSIANVKAALGRPFQKGILSYLQLENTQAEVAITNMEYVINPTLRRRNRKLSVETKNLKFYYTIGLPSSVTSQTGKSRLEIENKMSFSNTDTATITNTALFRGAIVQELQRTQVAAGTTSGASIDSPTGVLTGVNFGQVISGNEISDHHSQYIDSMNLGSNSDNMEASNGNLRSGITHFLVFFVVLIWMTSSRP